MYAVRMNTPTLFHSSCIEQCESVLCSFWKHNIQPISAWIDPTSSPNLCIFILLPSVSHPFNHGELENGVNIDKPNLHRRYHNQMHLRGHVELLLPSPSMAPSVFSVPKIHLHTDNSATVFCLFSFFWLFNIYHRRLRAIILKIRRCELKGRITKLKKNKENKVNV